MKQILTTLMLLFFLLGQVNLSWAKHYCGDELIDSEVTFSPEKSDCGASSAAEVPEDCCKDQITTVDADDHFSKSEIKVHLSAEFVFAYTLSFLSPLTFDNQPQQLDIYYEDHPLPDLYLLHQTFLI
ncbi:HYC_CC_PP family protein [Algoriphagus marinus]|uniref:HYC_CC_PP family protein n=1 Tax=Algoriphagus marinus TaxID=1925762 RepID=UPI000B1D4352|nr:hypothetical protein [Algoriphagus marinus]